MFRLFWHLPCSCICKPYNLLPGEHEQVDLKGEDFTDLGQCTRLTQPLTSDSIRLALCHGRHRGSLKIAVTGSTQPCHPYLGTLVPDTSPFVATPQLQATYTNSRVVEGSWGNDVCSKAQPSAPLGRIGFWAKELDERPAECNSTLRTSGIQPADNLKALPLYL